MVFDKNDKRNKKIIHFFIILILAAVSTVIAIKAKNFGEYEAYRQRQQKIMLQNKTLKITSIDFADGGKIPAQFTCDAGKTAPSPRFTIEGVPDGTKTFVMAMDDADIPEAVKTMIGKPKYNHWILFNIPGNLREITSIDAPGTVGKNDAGGSGYTGPCPPDNMEPHEHRYVFRLYALSEPLNFEKEPTLDEVETVAKEKATDIATYMGTYSRENKQVK